MDNVFQVGDRVVPIGVERYYGMTPEMQRYLDNETSLTVWEVRPGYVCTLPDHFSWSPENLRHESQEAREEAERKRREMMEQPASELIEKAKQKLINSAEAKGGQNGVAIHVQRDRLLRVDTGPCHGFVRNKGHEASVAIVTLLKRDPESSYGRSQCKDEVLVAYYDWLLARSPWSSCFYGRTGKKAVREGVTALRTTAPANMLQGALISTRNTWEFHGAINLWHKLVKQGVGENAAFLACHYVSHSGGKVRVCPVSRDHIAVSTGSMTAEGMKAFLEGRSLYTTTPYNQGGSYQGVHRAFLGNGNSLLPRFEAEFEKYGQVSSVIRNPFAKAKPRKSETREMSVEKYASFVKDIFPKLIGG